MKRKMKRFGKISMIFEFTILKLGYTEIFMKYEKKNFDSFFKLFLTNRGKNKNENKKNWENEFDFWIINIKITLYGNFHENLLKKILTQISGHFWLIETKIKMRIKKYGEIFSIFEYSISKLGYVVIFIKIREKNFSPSF